MQAQLLFDAVERILRERLAQCRKDSTFWEDRRAEAERKLEETLKEAAEIELAINVLRKTAGLPMTEAPTTSLDTFRFKNQPIAQSCLEIIQERGGAASVVNIVDILVQSGKLKPGRSAYGTVAKTLDRDERFRRLSPGMYSLALELDGETKEEQE